MFWQSVVSASWSFAGYVVLSLPSPRRLSHASQRCDRLVIGSPVSEYYEAIRPPCRLQVASIFVGFPFLSSQERYGSPKFLIPLSVRATPLDPGSVSKPSPFRALLVGFRHDYTVAHCSIPVSRLNSFTRGASLITAHTVPCVRLHRIVRLSPPLRCQHSVRVVGYSLPDRDFGVSSPSPCKRHQASLGTQSRRLMFAGRINPPHTPYRSP